MRKLLIYISLLLLPLAAHAEGKKVTYTVNGEAFEGYYTSNGMEAPLVILVHDWDGLTDYEVKRSEMLKNLGYSVFSVDLFGKGVRPEKVEDKKKLTGSLYKDRKRMRMLLDGGVAEAKRLGANIKNAVAIGYCFGGSAVLELARSGADLKAFVTFHGGLKTPEGQDYSKTKGKVLVLHGTADTSVTMDDFAKLASELEAKKINHEMVTYSGAPHAFTVFGSERYRKDADEKSWARFVGFLKETVN